MRHDFPTKGNGVSYYVNALGRNKKSVSFNLKNQETVEAFHKMAKEADIIVESFRPGVTKKLGIDYDTIKEINPRIIYCSISAYGSTDPRSLKPQHDLNMQATAGYLAVNHGSMSPLHLCDLSTGMVVGCGTVGCPVRPRGRPVRAATSTRACSTASCGGTRCWTPAGASTTAKKRTDLEYPSLAYNVYETNDGKRYTLGMVEPSSGRTSARPWATRSCWAMVWTANGRLPSCSRPCVRS